MNFTYSFIIPHHNTPDLLQRLIDSIPQREDIEIIVVDDNSDDDKKANINRPDVRTIYIDKEHTKGAGRARNVGMDAATGKWLLFADADDFYKSDFIDILDEYKDDDIEILFFNVDSVESDTLLPITSRSNLPRKLIENYNGSVASSEDLLYLCYTPWRRMQRLDFLRYYGLRFEEIPKGNDVFFTYQTAYFVKKWKMDSREVYIVTYRNDSMSYHPKTRFLYKNALLSLRKREKFFSYIGHSDWNKKCARGNNIHSVFRYLMRVVKHQPLNGIKAILYYLTHLYYIEKRSNYYIDVIEDIKSKVACHDILNNNRTYRKISMTLRRN